MQLTVLTLVFGVLILGTIIELLRRRRLREKYAALWLITAGPVLVLAAFPAALDRVSDALGIANGVSLILFLGIVFLLALCMHLSWEVSTLEEETRTLSEEVALMRLELGGDRPAARPQPQDPT